MEKSKRKERRRKWAVNTGGVRTTNAKQNLSRKRGEVDCRKKKKVKEGKQRERREMRYHTHTINGIPEEAEKMKAAQYRNRRREQIRKQKYIYRYIRAEIIILLQFFLVVSLFSVVCVRVLCARACVWVGGCCQRHCTHPLCTVFLFVLHSAFSVSFFLLLLCVLDSCR